MQHIAYQSYLPHHKAPFGALESGSDMALRIVLPRALACTGATLCICRDGENAPVQIPLQWEGMQGEYEEWWRCSCTTGDAGLYWYWFLLTTPDGEKTIYREGADFGYIGSAVTPWQLTVYDPAYHVPDWLQGGVLYQIFPDRFFASGSEKQNIPPERVLRDDWGAPALWEPDSDGRITRQDFFKGDLQGIQQKLPYLAALGVTCLYLNPIFEAHTNHRYDTADYTRVDMLLGTNADFAALCRAAQQHGIKILLDGVFSHTGADSVYFNREGRYNSSGAYQSEQSPYAAWYTFSHWPDSYDCWWDVDILPELREDAPEVLDFFCGENGIVPFWLSLGAAGWRLDVADELPDVFLDRLNAAAKRQNPQALILGEVWEDASNKTSYAKRRRYLLGGQLDSVMNYPFADAIFDFITHSDADAFFAPVLQILANYPPAVTNSLMNHIGTHDTMRVLSRLGGATIEANGRACTPLSPAAYAAARQRLQLASVLQFTLPGVPCIYYGDEAGLQGGNDPFNRACFPWGQEDAQLLAHYRALGALRKRSPALCDGSFSPLPAPPGCAAYTRQTKAQTLVVLANTTDTAAEISLPTNYRAAQAVFGQIQNKDGIAIVPACSAAILELQAPHSNDT